MPVTHAPASAASAPATTTRPEPPVAVLRHVVLGHGLGPGDAVLVAGPLASGFEELLAGLGMRVRRADETRAVEDTAAGGGFDVLLWAGDAATAGSPRPTAGLERAVRVGGQAITLAHAASVDDFAGGSTRARRFPDRDGGRGGWVCLSRTVLKAAGRLDDAAAHRPAVSRPKRRTLADAA